MDDQVISFYAAAECASVMHRSGNMSGYRYYSLKARKIWEKNFTLQEQMKAGISGNTLFKKEMGKWHD